MLVSEQLWLKLVNSHPILKNWQTFGNKYAVNGVLIDEDDNICFVNSTKTKAVKLMFEPESDTLFASWESEFGDEEMGIIAVLNIVFSDVEQSFDPFLAKFNEWY